MSPLQRRRMAAPAKNLRGAGGLLGRRHWRLRHPARTPGGALLALVRELLLPLQFLVQTNGLIFDDRVRHAEPPLELMNQLAMIRAHLLVNVDALSVFGDLVGQLARAP